MRALVTGSEGFIGKNLVAKLKEEGHSVEEWDIKNGFDCREPRWYPKVDVIYHLACLTQEKCENNYEENFSTNAVAAARLALHAEDIGAKIVFTSTASVYGQAKTIPTPNDAAVNPLTAYAVAKLAGEHFVKHTQARWTILRLSNVYGPHQTLDNPYCGVIGKFIDSALSGDRMKIYGTGYQTRDFTYVGDVVSAIIRSAELYDSKVLNVASGVETSINSLALEVSYACDTVVPTFSTVPRPIDGIQRRCLKSDIMCPVSLEKGLEYTVKWHRDQRGEGRTGSTSEGRSEAVSG